MKTFNYVAIITAILCFGGAVGASSLFSENAVPTTDKVVSYLNQAHLQDQAY